MECNKESVHLEDYPNLNKIHYDHEVVKENDLAISICKAIASIRKSNIIKNKIPLSFANIYHKDKKIPLNNEIVEIIKEEVNVKNIKFLNNIDDVGKKEIKINFKLCGAKFKKDIKEMLSELKKNNYKLINSKLLIANKFELNEDEFEIRFIVNNEKSMRSCDNGNIIVELNLDLSKELINEGIARDILRSIQIERKNLNLNVESKINISFAVQKNSLELKEIIKEHKEYISYNALIDNISFEELSLNSSEFVKVELKNILTEKILTLYIKIH